MTKMDKGVYIAHQRFHTYSARTIFRNLAGLDFHPFLNDQILYPQYPPNFINHQIATRAHFVLILTQSAMKCCVYPDNWLRLEIEYALELKRHVVILTYDGYGVDPNDLNMYGRLSNLKDIEPIILQLNSIEGSMQALCSRLTEPVSVRITPVPSQDRPELSERLVRQTHLPDATTQELIAEQVFEEGFMHQEQEEYDEALAVYSRVIELSPSYDIAFQARAMIHHQRANFRAALKDYHHALQLYPYDSHAYYNRAAARYQIGDYQGAATDFSCSIELTPYWDEPYRGRAGTKLRLGDPVAALIDAQTAIDLNPDSTPAYQVRANIHVSTGNLSEAIDDYTQAIRLNPAYADAFVNRSMVRRALGDVEGALADISQASILNPSADNYVDIGAIFYAIEDFEDAIEVYNQALVIEPGSVMAYVGRGITFYAKGNPENAVQDFSRAIQLDPENVEALLQRGIAYIDLKMDEAAAKDFTQAVQVDPRCYQAYYHRGLLRQSQDKLYLAIIDYSAAIDITSSDEVSEAYIASLYTKRAIAFLQLGMRQRALKDNQSALKLAPHDEYAYIGLAITYYLSGKIERSKQIWSNLVNLQPLHQNADWVINSYGLPLPFYPLVQGLSSNFES